MNTYLTSSSTNLNDLVYEWMYHWEGISDSQVQIRLDAAADFLQLFQNDPGTRNPWYKGNNYLSMAQAESNALLIMDWFLGGSPPPPGPGGDELPAILAFYLKKRRKGGYHVF